MLKEGEIRTVECSQKTRRRKEASFELTLEI